MKPSVGYLPWISSITPKEKENQSAGSGCCGPTALQPKRNHIWEVHITSILKLDRAERMDETAPEQEQVEDPEVAP